MKYYEELILGSVLGDGCIEKPSGKNINPTISFTQNTVNVVQRLSKPNLYTINI